MKIVVDSNKLQSEALRMFLSNSTSNYAVLTDYTAMEAYKGDTLASIYKSMSILRDFPTKVIVLKSTRLVSGLRGRSAGLQRRLIDNAQTDNFPSYVQQLYQAQRGDISIQKLLLDHGREATRHLDRMLVSNTTGTAIDDIAKLYSKEERRTIRLGETYSDDLIDKIVRNIFQIARLAFSNHPNVRKIPVYAELPNTFIFRVSLCIYLLALDWGAKGGVRNANQKTLRNDFVDMLFAAYATYFDGLMTADAKLLRIHSKARIWLMALFGCNLPEGLGHGFS